MKEINYQELLKKYIAHVLACEGTDFIKYYSKDETSVIFTNEEWEALVNVSLNTER